MCFAGKDNGFAKRVINWLQNTNPNITGWASTVPTTPVGSLGSMGLIRTTEGSYFGDFKEFLNDVFPVPVFRLGTKMPAPDGNGSRQLGEILKFEIGDHLDSAPVLSCFLIDSTGCAHGGTWKAVNLELPRKSFIKI